MWMFSEDIFFRYGFCEPKTNNDRDIHRSVGKQDSGIIGKGDCRVRKIGTCAFAHLRHKLAQDIVIARGTFPGTLKNEF